MAIPKWNFDWTQDDSWVQALFDARVYNKYVDAVNERLVAIGAGTVAYGNTGDNILQSWAYLTNNVVLGTLWFGNQYWPAYDGGGSPIAYSGSFPLGTETMPDPPLRRRYPREIISLAAAGSEGEIARYAGSTGGEQSYWGKLLKYSSGAWMMDYSDPMADVLSAAFSAGGSVGAASGDYFGISVMQGGEGSWFLNDLRDAINELVLSKIGASGAFYPTDPGSFKLTWDNNGENNYKYEAGLPGDETAGQQGVLAANWAGLTAGNYNYYPSAFNATAHAVGGSGSVVTLLQRGYSYPLLWNIPFAAAKNHQATFITYHTSEGAAHTFDAYGDGVQANGWNAFFTSGSSNAATLRGPKFGSLDAPTPWGSLDTPAGDGISYGYQIGATGMIALLRWDLGGDGGFTYTKYTSD